MREPYIPLFCSIIRSTLWMNEDSDTRVVFITLLAMMDPEGHVATSLPGIAKDACLSVDATRAAMARLEAPDPDSRSKSEEGRRVVPIERGWRVVNAQEFRDLARREAELARKRRWWAKHAETRRSLDALDESLDAPKSKAKGKERSDPPVGPPRDRVKRMRSEAKRIQGSWRIVPDSWPGPNENHHKLASKLGVDLTEAEATFRDHEYPPGKAKSDADRAFSNWLRKAKDFGTASAERPPTPEQLAARRARDAMDQRERERRAASQSAPSPSKPTLADVNQLALGVTR